MADKVRCPKCGVENYARDPKCLSCGTDLFDPRSERVCPKCGHMMGRLDRECPQCRLREAAQQQQPSAPPVAPPVEQQFSRVQCVKCSTWLSLDPPRKAGDQVSCGKCGTVITLTGPVQNAELKQLTTNRKVIGWSCGGLLGAAVLLTVIANTTYRRSARTALEARRADIERSALALGEVNPDAVALWPKGGAIDPVEIKNGWVTVHLDLRVQPTNIETVQATTDAACRYMVSELLRLGIDPKKEEVWVMVQALSQTTDLSPTGKPLVRWYGGSTYDWSHDAISFGEGKQSPW